MTMARFYIRFLLPTLLLCLYVISHGQQQQRQLINQTPEDVRLKSAGCLTCHSAIESIHKSAIVKLGCTDCHGGDPKGTTIEVSHIKARYP